MQRTFRYPLKPNQAQTAVLESWLVACQRLYNGALEHRIGAYRKAELSIHYNAQSAELTTLRALDKDWADVPVVVLRSALRRLDRAYQSFFRRVKAGEKPGFPRFRSRDRYDSFGIGRVKITDNRVGIPKLGLVRFHKYRELRGIVRNVEIKRRGPRWFVCISCNIGEAPAKRRVRSAVGIDAGLNVFVATSDGQFISNPRFFREGEAVLAQRQRVLARRQRGGAGRAKAKLLVANAHDHVHSQRLNYAWNVANDLIRRYDLIAYEDLNIRGMVRSNLAKSISDAAWGMLIHCVNCKAEEAGKTAVGVDPRGTSQRCSLCGSIVLKDRGERVHSCPTCGLKIDRDLNAARNILALGLSAASTISTSIATEALRVT